MENSKTPIVRIDSFVNSFPLNRMDFKVASDLVKRLNDIGFFTAPASTKYHGDYEGGLFDHSFAVAKHLVDLTTHNGLTWDRPESPYIVGFFHDLCKCDQYQRTESGFEYRSDTLLKGHGDKSVMIASTLMQLTEEEVMCIRYHMGAFTPSEEWNQYTGAIHRYPNVLWTHHADMMAAHVDMT